jgi:DNA replication protein
MNEFQGFPARMQFTAVPNIVFSAILPQIEDIDELKVLLHVLAILYPKKAAFRVLTLNELLSDAALAGDFKGLPTERAEKVKKALDNLVRKRILLHMVKAMEGAAEDYYCVNNEANRTIIQKIEQGETGLPAVKAENITPGSGEPPPDIFSIYEQNIGILTPLIAEELKEAQKHYPGNWISDAIKEAVTANKRNWRYIARVLEDWSTGGKSSGTHRGNPKTDTDPDKYIRGKYGHMVQR